MDGSESASLRPADAVEAAGADLDEFQHLLAEAQRLQLGGQLDRAIGVLEEAGRRFPDRPNLLYNLAHFYLQAARFGAAEVCYRRLLELRPGFLKAQMRLAVTLEKQGKLEAAAAQFSRAWQEHPTCIDAATGKGVCLLRLDRCQEALEVFEECLRLAPHQQVAQLARGVALQLLGRSAESEAAFAALVEAQPALAKDIAQMRHLYAGIRAPGVPEAPPRHAPKPVAANSTITPQPASDPASISDLASIEVTPGRKPSEAAAERDFHRACAALQKGDWFECVAILRGLLRAGEESPAVWTNLGGALWQSGDWTAALEAWQDGLKRAGDDPLLNRNAGVALAWTGEYAAAVRHLRLGLKAGAPDAEGWFALGLALAELGECGEAESAFERAIQADPSLAEAALNCGVLRSRSGDLEGARSRFESALTVAPALWQAQAGVAAIELHDGDLERGLRLLEDLEGCALAGGQLWLRAAYRLAAGQRLEEALVHCAKSLARADQAEAREFAEALQAEMEGSLRTCQ